MVDSFSHWEEDTDGHTFVSTFSPNAVYRSSSEGSSWEQTDLIGREVYSIKATSNNVLFAAAWDAILRSTDHGVHWEIVSQGLDSLMFTTICISPHNMIFVAGWYRGVLSSSDNGSTWQPAGLRGQTKIVTLACDNFGTVFAATSDSGVYRSTDNGVTWNTIDSLRFRVTSFAVNSVNRIFAGAYHGTMYQSVDSGIIWTRVGQGLPATTPVRPFLACASIDTIWAGTFSDGIFRSTDNGSNWNRIKRFVSWMSVEQLIFTKGRTLLAGTERGGIFRSVDQGTTWSTSGEGIGFQPMQAVAADLQGNIFAGCDAGVFMLRAGTAAWLNMVGVDSARTPFGVQSLTTNTNDWLFAGAYGGVFRTQDLGQSWSYSGLGRQTVSTINTPANTTIAVTSYYTVMGPEFFSDMFRSTNNGLSWNQVYTGRPVYSIASSPNGYIYAGADRGILKSMDDGQTWSLLGLGRLFVTTAVTAPRDDCILASTVDSLYRTTDGGTSWQCLGALGTRFNALISIRDSVVYAATTNRGVLQSSDQGLSWTQCSSGLVDSCILSLAMAPDSHLVCGTQTRGVFRTEGTVVSVSNLLAAPCIFELAQNYPNPFNSSTVIEFSVPTSGIIRLEIFDVLGRRAATLINGELPAGRYKKNWDATSLSSGLYFYRFQAGSLSATRKLLLLK